MSAMSISTGQVWAGLMMKELTRQYNLGTRKEERVKIDTEKSNLLKMQEIDRLTNTSKKLISTSWIGVTYGIYKF
jgi:hypothetical protein